MSVTVKHYFKKAMQFIKKLHRPNLSDSDGLCRHCNSLLTTFISDVEYNHFDCENWVKNSSNAAKTCLEEIIQEKEYHCKYKERGCHFYGSLVTVHESKCVYNLYCICKEVLDNKGELIEHFERDHYMQTIRLTKPMADISVNGFDQAGVLPYNLYMGNTSLILLLCTEKASDEIFVIIYNATDIPRNMNFIVKYEQSGGEYCTRGKVSDSLDVSIDENIKVKMAGCSKSTLKMPTSFKIYFDNYENVEPFDEYFQSLAKELQCPICFHTITDSVYQCTNGHNVCIACKTKLVACPMCRETNYSLLKMKNLAVQLQRPCQYANQGCFYYNMESEMVKHEQLCPMRTIQCELCENMQLTKNTFVDHMVENHDILEFSELPAKIIPGYLMFRRRVFEFKFTTAKDGTHIKYIWYFRLVYTSESESFYEFKLKFEREGGSCFIIKDKTQMDKVENVITFKADSIYDENIKHFLTIL